MKRQDFIEQIVSPEFKPPPAAISLSAVQDADPVAIADAAVSTWLNVEAELSPIIGRRGVAALYQRSLYLARTDHPCLVAVQDGALQPGAFDNLRSTLAQQSSAMAAAANGALLQTFLGLLASLLGDALSQRLLRAALGDPSSGQAAKDTSP